MSKENEFSFDVTGAQPVFRIMIHGNVFFCIFASSFNILSMEENPELNSHNKAEYPPMHTAEHILNQTMVRMFGCARSKNAHIERKKSKCDYLLDQAPTEEQITEIERRINEIIDLHLPVYCEFVRREEAGKYVDLSKLPANVSDTLRIVRVGDYDACACIGEHVQNTLEIGHVKFLSHEFENNRWRIRFKLVDTPA